MSDMKVLCEYAVHLQEQKGGWSKKNGYWCLNGRPTKVYNFYNFFEYEINENGILIPNGAIKNSIFILKISLEYDWFCAWQDLGKKCEGVPRDIKIMIWIEDLKLKIPVPYTLVECKSLLLWDVSNREALHSYLNKFPLGKTENFLDIKDYWIQEGPTLFIDEEEAKKIKRKTFNIQQFHI